MASLTIDTSQLVEKNHPEYFGSGQSFPLGEMTRDLLPAEFWERLFGSRIRGNREHDFLADLQDDAGGVWATGSVVKEVWPNYPRTEADRSLPSAIDARLIAGAKLAGFGGCLDMRALAGEQYLGAKLATYLLPPNIDVRFERTEWGEDEALGMIEQIASRFRQMPGWVGSVIQNGAMRELAFTNLECGAAGVCFYFKDQERSGGGLLTTTEWEGMTSARLWRRVKVERDESGHIIGESPAKLGRKGDIWCMEPQAIASVGQRSELLARTIREIAMTGRIPKNLKVESFGDPITLENKWTMRQWMMYVSNLMQAMVNDPLETKMMLEMIGVNPRWVKEGWPTSPEQVIADVKSCEGYDEWREILAPADDLLLKLGQVVSGSGKGMKLQDLAPLISMLSPEGYGVNEVMAMIPEPDKREVVVKIL